MNLNSLTFIIPVVLESQDRENNLAYSLKYLKSLNFGDILLVDGSRDASAHKLIKDKKINGITYLHVPLKTNFFHKSYLINKGVNNVNSEVVCIYDTDVIINRWALEESSYWVSLCPNCIVYPYNHAFYDVLGFDYTFPFKASSYETKLLKENSVGGAFLIQIDFFKSIGLMNEEFRGWGYEDDEINMRVKKLGYPAIFIGEDDCYHLHHERTDNSMSTHEYYEDNRNLYNKFKTMSEKLLREYYNIK